MHEFLTLFSKIFPLYLIVASGFIAAKHLKIDQQTVATILINIIAPAVIFNGAATAPASNTYLFLRVSFFLIS